MKTNRSKLRRSTYLPLALTLYLAFMAYVGRSYLLNGEYMYYFGVIGVSLVVIILLHFSLKRREALKEKRNNDNSSYGRYGDESGDKNPT